LIECSVPIYKRGKIQRNVKRWQTSTKKKKRSASYAIKVRNSLLNVTSGELIWPGALLETNRKYNKSRPPIISSIKTKNI
jgi:hypothetical protein